jgi:uncharacterized protein involved in exopolysaccharide biosynthesis
LLTSNNLLTQVVKATGLQRQESTESAPKTDREAVALELATARLQKALKITPVRKANIIEVKYASTNPHVAATVLRQFAETYMAAHLEAHSSPGSYDFFVGQALRYQNELKAIEADLAKFRERDNIVLLTQQKESLLQKSLEAQSALYQTQAQIGEYQSKIAHASGQMKGVDGRVVTSSKVIPNQYAVEHLNTMMAELQNKRTELLTKYRPEDRTVREVDQQIVDTQAALDKASKQTGVEQTTDVNPVRQNLEIGVERDKADLAGFEAKRSALSGQAQSYRSELGRLDQATAQYDDLVRHQKEVEDNYLLYSKRSEEARIAESLDKQKISNVVIIETPTEPHLPSKPNVPMNLALGTLLAGLISVGMALSIEFYQRPPRSPYDMPTMPALESAHYGSALNSGYSLSTVKGPADLEELTGVPVLALLDGHHR